MQKSYGRETFVEAGNLTNHVISNTTCDFYLSMICMCKNVQNLYSKENHKTYTQNHKTCTSIVKVMLVYNS